MSSDKQDLIGDLNEFEWDVLRVLAQLSSESESPIIGNDVLTAISDFGYANASTGRVYPCLDDLVEVGCVEKHYNVPDRRSNAYEITERGLELLWYKAKRDLACLGLENSDIETIEDEFSDEMRTAGSQTSNSSRSPMRAD